MSMESSLKSDEYLCSECNITFMFELNLKKHMDISHKGLEEGQKFIKCQWCEEKFSTHLALKFHQAQAHKHFSNVNLKRHLRGIPVTCHVCGVTVRHLSDHMNRKHINPNKYKTKCMKCEYVGRPGNLKNHFDFKHTRNKIKACTFCGEIFKNVQGHLERTNCGGEPKYFNIKVPCLYCTKHLANEDKLSRHVKDIHNQVRDKQCDQCDYNTYHSGNLKLHIDKQHLGITAEKQPCPHCYKKVGNLPRHVGIYHVDI